MVHDNLKSNPFNDLELSEKTSCLRDGYILSRMVYKTHGLSMNKIKIKVPPPLSLAVNFTACHSGILENRVKNREVCILLFTFSFLADKGRFR